MQVTCRKRCCGKLSCYW